MRCADAGQASWHDLPAFGDKLRQQAYVFVIDRFDLLGAEFAHFLAAEVLAASRTALARAAGAAGSRRTPLRARRLTLSCCCRRCGFVSHVAPSKFVVGRWSLVVRQKHRGFRIADRVSADDQRRMTYEGSRPAPPALRLPAPGLRARLYAWRRGSP